MITRAVVDSSVALIVAAIFVPLPFAIPFAVFAAWLGK